MCSILMAASFKPALSRRLMMVVNYNNDISEYWEWSGDPWMPIDETNEAYRYGVNYIMYALTH